MRVRIVLAFLMLAASCSLAQSSTSYNLTLHVVSSHLTFDCDVMNGDTNCALKQVLRAEIEGRMFEMTNTSHHRRGVLPLGDYPARLAGDKQLPSKEFTRKYRILLPDGKSRLFTVTGEEESPRKP